MNNTGFKKTAIIYVRVSSEKQVENTSLGGQERLASEFTAGLGAEVLKIFTDEGSSAKTADRPEFNKAMLFCKQHRVDYFVVYKVDRFARNQDDHGIVRAYLRRYGTELRSVTEPIDDSPTGRLMEGVLAGIAEFDNSVRAERSKNGMVERLRSGIWVFQPPVGYIRPVPRANIAPDPIQAPYIQMAFEQWAIGIYTFESLANYLADRGFRIHGKRPYKQIIEHILRNPLYSGVMVAWGQRYEGAFTPLVSLDLFNRCQRPVHKPAHGPRRLANNPLFPLRGTISCATCDNPLTGSSCTSKSGQKYPYYHHGRERCTDARFYPVEQVEAHFVAQLRRIAPRPKHLAAFRESLIEYWENEGKGMIRSASGLRRELAALERERQATYKAHQQGVYSDTEFIEQRAKIDEQINETRLLMSERASEAESLKMEEMLADCGGMIGDPAGTWLELRRNYHGRICFQKLVFQQPLRYDGFTFEANGTPSLSVVYQVLRSSDGSGSNLAGFVRQHWNELLNELQLWSNLAEGSKDTLFGSHLSGLLEPGLQAI